MQESHSKIDSKICFINFAEEFDTQD